MPTNLFANKPHAAVAKSTISFAAAGITSVNMRIITLVDTPLHSYKPDRGINGITGFEAGKGYYIIPKQDMDLSSILYPPITDLTQLATPGSFAAAAASDVQINLSWAAAASATGYVVDRATNVGFTTGVSLAIYTGAGLSFNDTGRTASTQYFYRLRATAAGFADSAYATANATTSASGGIDADAQAFITAKSISNSTQITAIDTLVKAFKTGGVWTKTAKMLGMVGGTAGTHNGDIKNPSTNVTFNGTWVHNANGAKPTPDAYIATGFNGSTGWTGNARAMGIYSGENLAEFAFQMGAIDSGTNGTYINPKNDSNLFAATLTGNGYAQTVANASGIGFYLITKDSGGTEKGYKNGAEQFSASIATVAAPNLELYAGAVNSNGAAAFGSAKRIQFVVIFNTSLTPTEVTAVSNAVAAFQTALSR